MSSLAPSSVLVLLRGEALSSQWLECGLNTDVWAYLCEKLCSDVSDIPLCRMEGMASFGQLKVWLTLNV